MKVDDNTNIEILEGTVYLHLNKHVPVVISAEDEYRKGIEIDLCTKCKCLNKMVVYSGYEKYCDECGFLEVAGKTMKQFDYEEKVKAEIENFINWFWSDDKDRERPLKALEEYHKEKNYNEI